MQTIHIDSLDELPHAAAAVINALEGRSVVVFRGEMGAGQNHPDPGNRRPARS